MYKFSPNEEEDKQYRKQAIDAVSDTASAPAQPVAPKSTQDMLNERLASMLDPDLQQRYKDRKNQAVEQQQANYQGPEAIQALHDGESMRALQTGLQRAANKFGSVGGDGGQKSDFGDTAAAFDKIDRQDFALKQDAYKQGAISEDKASDDEYQNTVARPQALQQGINSLDNQDRESALNAQLDPLKVSNAQIQNQSAQLDFRNTSNLNDANSAESQYLREYAKKNYPSLPVRETSTAAQLNALIPLVERKRASEEQSAARREAARQSALARADAAQARLDAAAQANAARADEARRKRDEKLGDEEKKKSEKYEKEDQEFNQRYTNISGNLNDLETMIEKTGTFEAFGPESGIMDSKIYQIAVDYAKIVDPASVAREGEVSAAQKYMLPIQGMFKKNSTAKAAIEQFRTDLKSKLASKNANVRGAKNPADTRVENSSAKPKTITQNGHTYTLNAAGEYE